MRRRVKLKVVFTTAILSTIFMICLYLSMATDKLKDETKDMLRTKPPKPFGNVLLVLIFNFPHYDNIPILREMYEDVFGKVVFCGPNDSDRNEGPSEQEPDFKIRLLQGYYGYYCAAVAMEMYPGYEGYMSGNDDMIINWWNLVNRDRTKVWEGSDVSYFTYEETSKDNWSWWKELLGLPACKKFYKDLKYKSDEKSTEHEYAYETALGNGRGSERCGKGWSDYFYIPERLRKRYMEVSRIAFKNRLFLEIAVSTMLRCLDDSKNFEKLDGCYLPSIGVWKTLPDIFWKHYNHSLTFIHPFKFYLNTKRIGEWNMKMLKENVINHTKALLENKKVVLGH